MRGQDSVYPMNRKDRRVLLGMVFLVMVLQQCELRQREPTSAKPLPVETHTMNADQELFLCPGMHVSNAPKAGPDRGVQAYSAYVRVNGIVLATAPVQDACLSSGFGMRKSSSGKVKLHKGLDYHQSPGGDIFTAGDGVVIERRYRGDYGNMVLIDHGSGVYTRYAHLASFADDLHEGARVTKGNVLGKMGNTADYKLPIHLHYELLIGDYDNPKKSFGLMPQDPFQFPSVNPNSTKTLLSKNTK